MATATRATSPFINSSRRLPRRETSLELYGKARQRGGVVGNVSQQNLRNAKRKVRAATHTIIATNKLHHNVGSVHAHTDHRQQQPPKIKQHSHKFQVIYESPEHSPVSSPKVPPSPKTRRSLFKALSKSKLSIPSNDENDIEVPVFALPRTDLPIIPERAELHQGFFVNMTLSDDCRYQRRRSFTNLMSMQNPDKQALEKTATTNVQYRSFVCHKTVDVLDQALALLANAA